MLRTPDSALVLSQYLSLLILFSPYHHHHHILTNNVIFGVNILKLFPRYDASEGYFMSSCGDLHQQNLTKTHWNLPNAAVPGESSETRRPSTSAAYGLPRSTSFSSMSCL